MPVKRSSVWTQEPDSPYPAYRHRTGARLRVMRRQSVLGWFYSWRLTFRGSTEWRGLKVCQNHIERDGFGDPPFAWASRRIGKLNPAPAKPKPLTKSQKKALVALMLLSHESPEPFHSRVQISVRGRGTWQGFPVATMRALESHGLAEPNSEDRVAAVESRECRCGCDRWRITDKGIGLANRFTVVEAKPCQP